MIPKKQNTYHVLINGKGGHSTANIYHCHFDINNLRFLVNGINFSVHEARDTYEEALHLFTTYYPHCNTQENIDFMNLNAPLDASNINNPCPRIHQRVAVAFKNKAITEQMIHTFTENTANHEINQFRTLVSERKHKLKKLDGNTSPFDFLPQHFNPRKATLPQSTLYYIDKERLNDRTPTKSISPQSSSTVENPNTQNSIHHPPTLNTQHDAEHNATTPNTLHIQQISTDNADEMSIISQTESLTLSQHYASASKRPKYSLDTNSLNNFFSHVKIHY